MEISELKNNEKVENEYAYLDRPGFTSEKFKIEIRDLPKFYGINELKKLLNSKMKLESCKIKILKPGSPWAYVCFRNQEDRQTAIEKLNGFKWKGKTLAATEAQPAPDPLVKRRNEEADSNGSHKKKRKTLEESTTSLHNLSYAEQLNFKSNEIKKVLLSFCQQMYKSNPYLKDYIETQRKLFGGLPFDMRPIKSSPLLDGYRNKCEFSVGLNEIGEKVVGFRVGSYSTGFTEVGSVENLRHIPNSMKCAVKIFQNFVRESNLDVFNHEKQSGFFRQLTVRISSATSEIMCIIGIHPQTLNNDELANLKKDLVYCFTNETTNKSLNITSLYYQEIKKRQSGQLINPCMHLYGKTHITDIIHGLKFHISPEAFFQINTLGAEVLYQCVIDLAAPTKHTNVLDVCCGTGTIGLCFAKHCKQVYGIEIIEQAVEDAKLNAKLNEIENCEFVAGSAEDSITSLLRRPDIKNTDVIAIVDPPRAGLHARSITHLRNAKGLNRLIYISCSPQSAVKNWIDLTRPCSKILKGYPFVPKVAVPVDMFPHTPHTELILLFERQIPTDVENFTVDTDISKNTK